MHDARRMGSIEGERELAQENHGLGRREGAAVAEHAAEVVPFQKLHDEKRRARVEIDVSVEDAG